ncbi:MAG: hypothetical protein ACJ736_04185 [Streptomyces sp.]
MSITARNPRRARLAITPAGLAVAVVGVIVWGTGETAKGVAETRMGMNSASSWGDTLGFDSDQGADYGAAVSDRDSASAQMTFGIVVILLGVALIGSRWFITAAPAVTLAKPAVEATLTPAQREQAIAVYLEGQKRADEQ